MEVREATDYETEQRSQRRKRRGLCGRNALTLRRWASALRARGWEIQPGPKAPAPAARRESHSSTARIFPFPTLTPLLLCCGPLSSVLESFSSNHHTVRACGPPSRPPTHQRSAQAAAHMTEALVRAPPRLARFDVLGPHAGPVRRCGSVIHPLLLSEHARGARGPLRPLQSRSGHVRCGTLSVSVARREQPARDRTRSTRERNARRRYTAFMMAPLGTTPLVAYRHNAITSFRATATMPMRRARLPVPNRSRYQRVSALWGCQCTQLQAS
jgi:hypothetical protein